MWETVLFLLPHRQSQQAEEQEGWYLQEQVVPRGWPQVVQNTARYRAFHGESVVGGAQQQVHRVNAQQVTIHEQLTHPYIAHRGPHPQQQGYRQGCRHEDSMHAEKEEVAQRRKICLQRRGDEALQAGGQRPEVQQPAGCTLAGP